MKILYRISESSNKIHEDNRAWQKKPEYATKKNCLLNVIKNFPKSEIVLFVDQITDETLQWLKTLNLQIVKINEGSEAKSFRCIIDYAIQNYSNDQLVLLQEDDYLYINRPEYKMMEALQYADYVTGYLHPDKFIGKDFGGNPFVERNNESELTRVYKTSDHFWMVTNSTTNTFLTKVKTLKEDYNIFMDGTKSLIHTDDFSNFIRLREKGRKLLQPIPSLASHCLIGFEAPLNANIINSWKEAVK